MQKNVLTRGRIRVRRVYRMEDETEITVCRPYCWINLEEIEGFEQNTWDMGLVKGETKLIMYSGVQVIDVPFDEFEVIYLNWLNEHIKEGELKFKILN